MHPRRGDVVRSADPFKLGEDRQRPWLVLNAESHPFDDEQCIAAAISTKKYDRSLALDNDVWVAGGIPCESYVSPWAIHSPRTEDFVTWQGRVGDEYVESVVDELVTYLQ